MRWFTLALGCGLLTCACSNSISEYSPGGTPGEGGGTQPVSRGTGAAILTGGLLPSGGSGGLSSSGGALASGGLSNRSGGSGVGSGGLSNRSGGSGVGSGGTPSTGGASSGGLAAETGGQSDQPSPCTATSSVAVELQGLQVVPGDNAEALRKGSPVTVRSTVRLDADCEKEATVQLWLSSERFDDLTDVPMGEATQVLQPGDNEVEITAGPFLSKPDAGQHFAMGSGNYRISRLAITAEGMDALSVAEPDGGAFELASSGALFVPVIYDQRYFDQLDGNTAASPEAYMTQVVTRPGELFTPSGDDPDGDGSFQRFEGGFDEMMGVTHFFKAFPGFPGEDTTTDGWCEDATAYGAQVLGMNSAWLGSGTRANGHGFDYIIALTPDLGGGVACGWIDVQVSSLINRDVDRQQVIAVHESGHLFGAPHCDDVGNGDGGSLQGYVMCSGEKHARYPGAFVWHQTSRDRMGTHWD